MQREQGSGRSAYEVGHDTFGLGLRVEVANDKIGLECRLMPGSATNGCADDLVRRYRCRRSPEPLASKTFHLSIRCTFVGNGFSCDVPTFAVLIDRYSASRPCVGFAFESVEVRRKPNGFLG